MFIFGGCSDNNLNDLYEFNFGEASPKGTCGVSLTPLMHRQNQANGNKWRPEDSAQHRGTQQLFRAS